MHRCHCRKMDLICVSQLEVLVWVQTQGYAFESYDEMRKMMKSQYGSVVQVVL